MPYSRSLESFLNLAAFFMVALVLLVRPLFSGLAAGFDQNTLVLALTLAAAVLVLLRGILMGRLPFSIGWPLMPLFGLVVLSAVLAVRAPYRYEALLSTIKTAGFFLLVYAAGAAINTPARARLVLAAVLATATLVAVYGVYQRYVEFPKIAATLDNHVADLLRHGRLTPELVAPFKHRVLTFEVFSTFLLSNSLACYLVMLFFPAVFWLVTAVRRKGRFRTVEIVSVSFLLGLVAFVLYLTKVKGAWLTAGAVAVLAIVVFWRHLPKAPRWLLPGLVLAGLVGGIGLWAVGRFPTRVFAASVEVRLGYWQGALELVRQHPILGIGPGNFHDAYLGVKTPWATEVNYAHSAYLGLWSELGTPGLFLYLVFWAMVLRTLLGRPRAPSGPSTADPAGRWAVGAAGLAAILFQFLFIRLWTLPPELVIALIVLWVVIYAALSYRSAVVEQPDWVSDDLLMRASVCGLLVFLLHSAIDFDLEVPGIIATVVGLVACARQLRGSDHPVRAELPDFSRSRMGYSYALLAVVVLLFVLWLVFVMPPAQAAWNVAMANGYRAEGDLARWQNELKKAQQAAPGDAEVVLSLAQIADGRYRSTRDPKLLTEAVKLYQETIRLRPLDNRADVFLARLCFAAGNDTEALAAVESGIRKYPTLPLAWKLEGEIQERLGMKRAAAESYRRALGLAAVSGQEERRFSPQEVQEMEGKIRTLESGT